MNYTDFKRKIINNVGPVLPDLKKRNNKYGFFILFKILIPYFFFLSLSFYFYNKDFLILIIVLNSIFAYKISFILHDCAHDTLFEQASLNSFVGQLCGYLILSNFRLYKKNHLNHHAFLGNIDKDLDRNEYVIKDSKLLHFFKPLIGLRIVSFLKLNSAKKGSSLSFSDVFFYFGAVSYQIIVCYFISGEFKYLENIFYYFIIFSTIPLFLGRLRTSAEHGARNTKESQNESITKSHYPNLIDKLFLYDANFNYHMEHHLFPDIPSCNNINVFNYTKSIHTNETLGKNMLHSLKKI